MKHSTSCHFANLAQIETLDIKSVDLALLELLDAVRAHEVPAAAQSEMNGFYDRYQPWRNHFLHHFSPFVCDADDVFQVRQQRPHLLDLGSGVATQSHLFALRGARVTGLDNNAARVHAGRAMTPWFADRANVVDDLHVTLDADDAFDWLTRQPAGSFDGCYTQFALAYMRPHPRMLALVDRVVRPGGRVLFREFNAGSVYNRLVSRVDWLSAAAYRHHAEKLGWQLEQAKFNWVFPRQIMNWQWARNTLGPLEGGLTGLPMLGPALAAAMTLVFVKPT